ncbi:unnamed protein product [[Candida] boidinii]|uniref:Unnamed protein product n=1 Tax=Candida boidinii TaxID=5477 RepID=A0ACB5TV42_CANBO|nr:unnamed protein product [[Candida] boidinii]
MASRYDKSNRIVLDMNSKFDPISNSSLPTIPPSLVPLSQPGLDDDKTYKYMHNNQYNNKNGSIIHKLKYFSYSIFKSLRIRHLLVLYLIWCIAIQFCERTYVYYTIKKCKWDQWEDWSYNNDGNIDSNIVNPYHSVIIGDPQIIDQYSYPNKTVGSFLKISQTIVDNYLHRNHIYIKNLLNPDSILFIGDLFDGGRDANNEEWYKEYKRFNKIFNKFEDTKIITSIPGNHDIGFGNGVNIDVLNRFKTFFGDSNDYLIMGNHSIILMDTVSLSNIENEQINKESNYFLNSLNNPKHNIHNYPKILLTHVPLYRFTERQLCGPLRERNNKRFPVMKGKQYQTVLEYDLSQRILNTIKPKIIFSGDDHDYCHIRHPLQHVNDASSIKGSGESFTDEITVKSSTMTGGIKKPAIQLLSLWNPLDSNDDMSKNKNKDYIFEETGGLIVKHDTLQSRICFLPEGYHSIRIYISLLILNIISFIVIFIPHKISFKIMKLYHKFNSLILNNSNNNNNNNNTLLPMNKDKSNLIAKKNNDINKFKDKILKLLNKDWEISDNIDIKSLLLNVIVITLLAINHIKWYINSI